MERKELIERLGKNITHNHSHQTLHDVIKALLEPDEYYKIQYNDGATYIGGQKEGYVLA